MSHPRFGDDAPLEFDHRVDPPPPPAPSPWRPMQDPLDLKHLGKLAEEAGELGQATARCIIQGIDGREPTTGKPNRQWLEEEIADVRANCLLVERRFGLNKQAIAVRTVCKMEQLEAWHAQAVTPVDSGEPPTLTTSAGIKVWVR